MRPANYVAPKTVMIGTEMLVILEGGEEWSLVTDDPQFELRKKEWDHFNPAEFQPANLRGLLDPLDQSA